MTDFIGNFVVLLAMAPPQGGGQAPGIAQFFPLILMFVIFYVILIRPQQKKAREHEALLKTLKVGDKIVTNGGISAVIINVKERTVVIRSSDSKLEVLKSAVQEITDRSGSQGAESTTSDSGESKAAVTETK